MEPVYDMLLMNSHHLGEQRISKISDMGLCIKESAFSSIFANKDDQIAKKHKSLVSLLINQEVFL